MEAAYVFGVTIRLSPAGSLRVDPATVDTRLYRPADPPGDPGWLFFRDNLWRGDLGDPDHFRDLTDAEFSAQVESVEYRAFETDRAYLDALEDSISENLAEFNADSVTDVIRKYFGSSIEVA